MNIVLDKKSDNLAHLSLRIDREDYAPKVEKEIDKYRKQASIKGFRQGKVPRSVIINMTGERLLADTLNEVLSTSINQYIEEQSLDVIGYPIPTDAQPELDLNYKKAESFDFEYEMGLVPSFEVGFIEKNPKVTRETVEMDDSTLDEEILKLRKRHGSPSEVEAIGNDSVINVKIEELGADKLPFDGSHSNETSITLDMLAKDRYAKKFIGKKVGDYVDLEILGYFKDDAAALSRHVLGAEPDRFTKKDLFRIHITKIQDVELAEVDQAFYDALFGPGTVTDEQSFRDKLTEIYSKQIEEQADKKMIGQVIDGILDKTKIDLPEAFLKRWIMRSNEKPITEEEVEKDYPEFSKRLKWSLIVNRIGKDQDIKVEPEEIKDHTATQLRAQMASYGLADLGDEQVEQYVMSMLQQREHVEKTRDAIMEEKLNSFFKSKVRIKDKKVTLEQFTS